MTAEVNSRVTRTDGGASYRGMTGVVVDAGPVRVQVLWDDRTVPNAHDPANRPPTIRKGKRTWVKRSSVRVISEPQEDLPMPEMTEPRLAWTRMPDGSYLCEICGREYEIQKYAGSQVWTLTRDGEEVAVGRMLAEMKRVGVRAAQEDAGLCPPDLRNPDITHLASITGRQTSWITAYVPSDPGVHGQWYVLHTRTRAAIPCRDQAVAVGECRRRNAG